MAAVRQEDIDALLEHLKQDYLQFIAKTTAKTAPTTARALIDQFDSTLELEIGRKYTKIKTSNGVKYFVVNKPVGKFKEGDILKAASEVAPAKNFPRGNVIRREFENIHWFGG